MSRSRTLALAGAIALGSGVLAATSSGAQAACNLASAGNNIKHVVHITFDNVHLRRDNPNVPSDLEQMPNLLNFIVRNGTISGNHHTPLISHTATDILTALTGNYGDRMGVPVANSYGFFRPNGSVAFSELVPLLDLAVERLGRERRRPAADARRPRQDTPGAVGAVHPRRLRRRRVLGRQHRVREHPGRRGDGVRRELAPGPGDQRPPGQQSQRQQLRPSEGAAVGQHRLARHRGALRSGKPAVRRPQRRTRPPARRAGRLYRLQRALRQHQRGAGDLRDRGQSGGVRRAQRGGQRQGRVRHRA